MTRSVSSALAHAHSGVPRWLCVPCGGHRPGGTPSALAGSFPPGQSLHPRTTATNAEVPARYVRQVRLLVGEPVFPEGTPLWYYILREAEMTTGGAELGPVGGGIVAEVGTTARHHNRPARTPARARCALDRPYIVRSVSSVSTPRGTFMKTSACMLVASVFRVMMSDKVVFCTMRTSAGSSAFSK